MTSDFAASIVILKQEAVLALQLVFCRSNGFVHGTVGPTLCVLVKMKIAMNKRMHIPCTLMLILLLSCLLQFSFRVTAVIDLPVWQCSG